MAQPFEYDVFISFAKEDEQIVRPLWEALSAGGLRVFWSDVTLRDRAGDSWFDVIEASLERSRHFLLVCTAQSMRSEWVTREYRAFLGHCHRPPDRRLIPVLAPEFTIAELPLFLREIEVSHLADDGAIRRLMQILKGRRDEEPQALVQDDTGDIAYINGQWGRDLHPEPGAAGKVFLMPGVQVRVLEVAEYEGKKWTHVRLLNRKEGWLDLAPQPKVFKGSGFCQLTLEDSRVFFRDNATDRAGFLLGNVKVSPGHVRGGCLFELRFQDEEWEAMTIDTSLIRRIVIDRRGGSAPVSIVTERRNYRGDFDSAERTFLIVSPQFMRLSDPSDELDLGKLRLGVFERMAVHSAP